MILTMGLSCQQVVEAQTIRSRSHLGTPLAVFIEDEG